MVTAMSLKHSLVLAFGLVSVTVSAPASAQNITFKSLDVIPEMGSAVWGRFAIGDAERSWLDHRVTCSELRDNKTTSMIIFPAS